MTDPYYSYGALADRGNVPSSNFPGYLSSEAPALVSRGIPVSGESLPTDVNSLRPSSYGIDDISGAGVRAEPVVGGKSSYSSPLKDPTLVGQRGDALVSFNSPTIPDVVNDRLPSSLRGADGPLASRGESNLLFVGGLPTDCTRREVGHLFRPFIGYKDIKVVHKEARRVGDRAMVLCFVEFIDAKCARTAMEALQGYKFDDKKPSSPILRIQFAHFPFHLPCDRDE